MDKLLYIFIIPKDGLSQHLSLSMSLSSRLTLHLCSGRGTELTWLMSFCQPAAHKAAVLEPLFTASLTLCRQPVTLLTDLPVCSAELPATPSLHWLFRYLGHLSGCTLIPLALTDSPIIHFSVARSRLTIYCFMREFLLELNSVLFFLLLFAFFFSFFFYITSARRSAVLWSGIVWGPLPAVEWDQHSPAPPPLHCFLANRAGEARKSLIILSHSWVCFVERLFVSFKGRLCFCFVFWSCIHVDDSPDRKVTQHMWAVAPTASTLQTKDNVTWSTWWL